MKGDLWKLLHVFENKVRVDIISLLLQYEMLSLSDIAGRLEETHGWKMTLPGVLKHMRELESVGIVRQETGMYLKNPDARKTIYLLEGAERVQEVLRQLGTTVDNLLHAGMIFHDTAKLARRVQSATPRLFKEDKNRLETLLVQCESEEISVHLTEDEKKKVKLWKIMLSF